MTLLHPARAGSAITVWFVRDLPVRLTSGSFRFRVVGDPKCADINGVRYWRVRARSDDGADATFDLRQSGGDWVLDGVDQTALDQTALERDATRGGTSR